MNSVKIKECINCINTTANPSIIINKSGLCNVCEHYLHNKIDKNKFKEDLDFLKSFITQEKYDAMVGISGGKDSTATLYTVKKYGFSPLAFTFDIGYTLNDIFSRAEELAKSIGVDYEIINIKKYIKKIERESFQKMADLYDEKEDDILKDKFKNLYAEGRHYYSTKSKISFPFVRPCQICRKVVIPAYYAEACNRNINIVFIGINEWTGLSENTYSAIRKLQPYPNKPPVYIVHLPFLLQRKFSDTKLILKKLHWKKPRNDKFIDSGANACLLARACEAKAQRMLGFHIDSTRLARETTVGFITKKQAKNAINTVRESSKTVREVLEDAGII